MALFVDGEETLAKLLQLDFRNGCRAREYLQLTRRMSSHMKDHIYCQPTGKNSPLAITCSPLTCFRISNMLVTIPCLKQKT